MNFYGAAIREVLPGPPGHTLVRLWPPSPHPRVYVLIAFARALDGVATREYGPTSCAAVYRPHPEAATNAIDLVLPVKEGEDPRAAAHACVMTTAKECHQFMLAYHDALSKVVILGR